MIGNTKRHRWRRVQRLMHAAPIVVRHIKAHGRGVAFEFLAKAVGQPREPPRSHADRKVRALDEAGRDFGRHAGYHLTAYRYYGAWAVAVCRVFAEVGYRQRLYNDAPS